MDLFFVKDREVYKTDILCVNNPAQHYRKYYITCHNLDRQELVKFDQYDLFDGIGMACSLKMFSTETEARQHKAEQTASEIKGMLCEIEESICER